MGCLEVYHLLPAWIGFCVLGSPTRKEHGAVWYSLENRKKLPKTSHALNFLCFNIHIQGLCWMHLETTVLFNCLYNGKLPTLTFQVWKWNFLCRHSHAVPLLPPFYTLIFPICHINCYLPFTTQIFLALYFAQFFNLKKDRLQKKNGNASMLGAAASPVLLQW